MALQAAVANQLQTGGVERRSNLSYAEFVKEYLRPEKPVIITDAFDHWPARHKWTPEFFRTNFPDKPIVVEGVETTMGAFMETMLASTPEKPSPYLNGLFVRQGFREIAADIEPDLSYTLPDRVRSPLMVGPLKGSEGIPELLIAGRGSRFRLHYDALHALGFVTQIYGDKEFILFAPEDGKYLYSPSAETTFSQIPNIFEPDYEKYPLLTKATPIRFVLRAGETIFHPSGWWHATRLLTPSIAMVISTINAANWADFVADISRPRQGVPAPAAALLRGYLHCVGVILTIQERLFATPRA